MSSSLGPSPRPLPQESLAVDSENCTNSTALPTCVASDTQNESESTSETQSTQRLSLSEYSYPDDLLDEQLQYLLTRKLSRRMLRGRPSESLDDHRRRLFVEIAGWMGAGSMERNEAIEEEEEQRHALLCLLATSSKQNLKEIPTDSSEWTRLLTRWLKANVTRGGTGDELLANRDIYRMFAVDGFKGFKPHHLRFYLTGGDKSLRKEYKLHVRGVRCMYDFFETNDRVSCLTGTHSACVIFLALLGLWSTVEGEDDQKIARVHTSVSRAEGYIQQQTEYYRDLKNVDERLLEALRKIYLGQVKDAWKTVGPELVEKLGTDE